MKFMILCLVLVMFLHTGLMKNINVVLTFSNVNLTQLGLILNQNMFLSACPANNYTINFLPFNDTLLYQSPLKLNNFESIDLVFGPNKYYPPSFYGFTTSSTNFVFQSSFIPNFDLDFSTRYLMITSVLNYIIANDNVKTAIFIVNATQVDPMEPWKTWNPHRYLTSFVGTISVLYYTNLSDAVRIANEIKLRAVPNIVMDLNYNASLTVLRACNDRNLLIWRQRWMIFFSLLPYNVNISQITFPLSNNLTLYDFGRISALPTNLINSERDVYYHDICYTIVKLMDFQNCNQAIPSVLNLGTGTAVFNGQTITRTSWTLQAFQSSGSINIIGNISVNPSNVVTINQPLFPNLTNRSSTQILTEMRSKIFRVAAMYEKPFVYNDSTGAITGYSVDIINAIMQSLNVSIQIVPYNLSTGTLQNGIFSGVLGILQNGQADIAIGPITYFSNYAPYLNFTTTLKTYKIAIMYQVTTVSLYQEMFEFIFAFTWSVWIIIIASCFVYACALTVVNLISPNEAKMSLYDTFFFTMGSMVQGVTTALPDKVSGRILVIFWWILNIGLLLAYVANYGAYRTNQRLQRTIQDYTDLLQQTLYAYGTVINSSISEYFNSAQSQTLQQINAIMRTVYSQYMFNSTTVAVGAVMSTQYAFIYSDAFMSQYQSTRCITISEGFDQLSYTFALVDSDYTAVINNALNNLISQNVLVGLNTKYFTTLPTTNCITADWLGYLLSNVSYQFIPNPTNSLNIQQTAGIFVIMLVGIIISIIVALIEFIVKKFSKKKDNSESDA